MDDTATLRRAVEDLSYDLRRDIDDLGSQLRALGRDVAAQGAALSSDWGELDARVTKLGEDLARGNLQHLQRHETGEKGY